MQTTTIPQAIAQAIHKGRRVRFNAGIGYRGGEGVIVEVHGEPNLEPRNDIQVGGLRMGRILPNDCTFDVVLFDGRRHNGIRQCGLNRPGIGFSLLDRVHGPALVYAMEHKAAQKVADDVTAAAMARDAHERAEAARKIADPPLFYWNGLKDAKGAKLQKAWYSPGPYFNLPDGTITIHYRNYRRASDKVRACFNVENDSDTQTDYFQDDRIRVIPSHPLYPQVKAALDKQEAHRDRRAAKRAGGAA